MAAITGPLAGWLLFAALVTSVGSLAARAFIRPRVGAVPDPAIVWLKRASASQALVGGLALPVAMALVFYRQFAEFRDPFIPWLEDAQFLLGTSWGITWIWGMVGAVVAAVAAVLAVRRHRVGWIIGGPAVVALCAFPALTGHASGTGPLRPLTIAADTLHVLAAGGWIGTLGFVLRAEWGWRRSARASGRSLLPVLVPRFSRLAIACAGTLVVTGLLASWIHLPSLEALVSTRYGRLLSLKLLLVGAVAGLGFVNWRALTPRLGVTSGRRALRAVSSAELLLAHVVLLITAILVVTPPGG